METFTAPREFVATNRYDQDRKRTLSALDLSTIDEPMADLIAQFMELSHCFTLQCCDGHFLCHPGQDIHSLEPVAPGYGGPVTYRIASIALCIQNGPRGRALRRSLEQLTDIDRGYVQFGSADWFWERCVNSYALQVEPEKYQTRDQVILDGEQARHVQRTRDRFFQELSGLLARDRAENMDLPAVS